MFLSLSLIIGHFTLILFKLNKIGFTDHKFAMLYVYKTWTTRVNGGLLKTKKNVRYS